MIIAALIYRSYSPGVLLILGMIGACIVGVATGILLFLQGFRLLRRHRVSAQPHQGVETLDVSSRGFTLPLKSISVSMRGRAASREHRTPPEVGIGAMAQHLSVRSDSHLALVRLSPDPAPLRASEMSQQQKIAAALFKAGMSSPGLWGTAAELRAHGGAQALDTPAPGDPEPFRDRSKGDTDKG